MSSPVLFITVMVVVGGGLPLGGYVKEKERLKAERQREYKAFLDQKGGGRGKG